MGRHGRDDGWDLRARHARAATDFDVFPDGHFLMGEADPDARPTRLQVVLGSRS